MAKLDSTITEVTVFSTGARVTRSVVVTAEGGQLPAALEVPGLPLSTFDATVRVRVDSVSGRGTVWACQVRVGLYAREPDEVPSPPADEAKRRVQRELEQNQRALNRLEQEIEMLSGVEVPDRPVPEEGKPPPTSPMAARVALEQFCDEAITKRITALRELREQRRLLERERLRLVDEANQASSATEVKAGDLAKVVLAQLACDGEVKEATLLIDYLVPGARWVPGYQIRLKADASAAEIQHRALITQRSGEDWRNVRLRLSTAAPLSFSELPELSSVRIGRAQPPAPAPTGFRPPPRGAVALYDDFDRGLHRARECLPKHSGWRSPELPLAPLAPAAPRVRPMGLTMSAGAPPPPTPAAAPVRSGARRMRSAARAMREEDDIKTGAGDAVDRAAVEFDDEEMDSVALEAPEACASASLEGMDLVDDADVSAESTAQYAALPKKKRAVARPGGRGQATLEVVAFTSLRLMPPDAAGHRGRLQPVDRAQSYLEVLTRGALKVKIDVLGVVDEATRQARASTDLPLPPGTVDVRRSKGSFDFVYDTDVVVDVASDYTWHSVPVSTRAGGADVRYVVVPREDPSVFRVATLINPFDGPLLPGPAEVYVGGEYVLTTQLPTVAPRGELTLGLGVEQAIKCARNTRYEERRSGEERVAMTELRHTIVIDLVNHLARQATIEVRERIPQPADDAELVVDEAGVEPVWQPYDQSERGQPIEGGRRWQVTLDAGAEQQLRGGYVVKLYAVNEIVGGNRREA